MLNSSKGYETPRDGSCIRHLLYVSFDLSSTEADAHHQISYYKRQLWLPEGDTLHILHSIFYSSLYFSFVLVPLWYLATSLDLVFSRSRSLSASDLRRRFKALPGNQIFFKSTTPTTEPWERGRHLCVIRCSTWCLNSVILISCSWCNWN